MIFVLDNVKTVIFARWNTGFYGKQESQGEVLPIEVKSGKDYERHRALSNIMDNEEYAIPKGFVFCQENTKINGRLVYLPIYMIMFFQHEKNDDLTYQFDLTGLK